MTWQDEMKSAFVGYVIVHGGLVREDGQGRRSYTGTGWRDYDDDGDAAAHMSECTVDLPRSSWEDSDWEEFAGTYAEPPWQQRSGTDAVVWCACGQVQGRHWRYTGGLADLIRAVTTSPDCVKA